MAGEFRNHTTRDERVARWNAARAEGLQHEPVRLTGTAKALYRWKQLIRASDLHPMTRLVAHTLACYGTADGSSIYPGIRQLARETGLNKDTVSARIDELVRRGYLWRATRRVGTAGATGFAYVLCAPKYAVEGVRPDQTPDDEEGVRPHRTANGSEVSGPTGQLPIDKVSGAVGQLTEPRCPAPPDSSPELSTEVSDRAGHVVEVSGPTGQGVRNERVGVRNEPGEVSGPAGRRTPSEFSIDDSNSGRDAGSLIETPPEKSPNGEVGHSELRRKVTVLAGSGMNAPSIMRALTQYGVSLEQVEAWVAEGRESSASAQASGAGGG